MSLEEAPETPAPKAEKREIDWAGVELHYRAGIRSLRSIGTEFGVSDAGILKRAKRDGWDRNLKARIDARAAAKVSAAAVSAEVKAQTKVTEAIIVEAVAERIAGADDQQQRDVASALSIVRTNAEELAALSMPKFKSLLEWLADNFDESSPTWKDKANEAYRYTISLPGRVKMAKELAAAHGVYIPLQRKVLRMDDEADKSKNEVDALLASVIAGR